MLEYNKRFQRFKGDMPLFGGVGPHNLPDTIYSKIDLYAPLLPGGTPITTCFCYRAAPWFINWYIGTTVPSTYCTSTHWRRSSRVWCSVLLNLVLLNSTYRILLCKPVIYGGSVCSHFVNDISFIRLDLTNDLTNHLGLILLMITKGTPGSLNQSDKTLENWSSFFMNAFLQLQVASCSVTEPVLSNPKVRSQQSMQSLVLCSCGRLPRKKYRNNRVCKNLIHSPNVS